MYNLLYFELESEVPSVSHNAENNTKLCSNLYIACMYAYITYILTYIHTIMLQQYLCITNFEKYHQF